MREPTLVSRILGCDYRVSRTSSTLRVEVLDYHAGPLTITEEELRLLGLFMVDASELDRRSH